MADRYLVTRARRGWDPSTPHPGFDEFVDGKLVESQNDLLFNVNDGRTNLVHGLVMDESYETYVAANGLVCSTRPPPKQIDLPGRNIFNLDFAKVPAMGYERDYWFHELVASLVESPNDVIDHILREGAKAAVLEYANTRWVLRFDLQLGDYSYGEQEVELVDGDTNQMQPILAQIDTHYKGRAKLTNARMIEINYNEHIRLNRLD